MNVIVTLEQRFVRTPDGSVWTPSVYAHAFWERYLAVFDHVRVVARVREVSFVPEIWRRADGKDVSFSAVPYYVGPLQYLLRAHRVKHAARKAVRLNEAVILRLSSQIAPCIEPTLRQTGHPYGVEVVGDPLDVFAPGAVKHPLSPLFRWWFPRNLRRQCAGACAVAYVTERALQRRYPPPAGVFSTNYSSVDLPESAFTMAIPRPARSEASSLRLVTVASLDQMYKGTDVLIDAVAHCVDHGLDLKLALVGDGKHRYQLEAKAARLGLGDRVCFRGGLPAGEAVRAQLDQADLFVLPSRTEGLPRAMIEAMARGLPCIGTTIGGIPELLSKEDIVPPGQVAPLAAKIREVVGDPARRAQMSASNLAKAREYSDVALRERRTAFYRQVRTATESWLRETSRAPQDVKHDPEVRLVSKELTS